MSKPLETSDQELWRRAADGEAECFGLIFDRHAAAVHAYCRARSSGSADEIGESAADLVSVVFLEAWRRRRDVVLEAESALPWLIGVARRVMLHRARTVRRHRAALARLPSVDSGRVEDPADDIARRLDDTRRLVDVRHAFARLRERDREVLLVCVWGGLDYAAAAVALGVPVGTVRSRLSRARARLAELADTAPPPSIVPATRSRIAPASEEQS